MSHLACPPGVRNAGVTRPLAAHRWSVLVPTPIAFAAIAVVT
jgi:hypothetical protein